jgi:hypothetical protein
MPDAPYNHRSTVDKLGIKVGSVVAVQEVAFALDATLRREIEARSVVPGDGHETVDVVLILADAESDVVTELQIWRERIAANGGIWVLTPKRRCPGYVDQRTLIPMGAEAGMVDNKVCSVSDTVSGMRFVIRRKDRNT